MMERRSSWLTGVVCALEVVVFIDDGIWLGVVGEDMFEGEEGAETDIGNKDGFCGLGFENPGDRMVGPVGRRRGPGGWEQRRRVVRSLEHYRLVCLVVFVVVSSMCVELDKE